VTGAFRIAIPLSEDLVCRVDETTGKVRYIGTSSMHAWQFTKMLYLADRHAWRFVSMQNLVPHSVVVVKAFWASLLYWSPHTRQHNQK